MSKRSKTVWILFEQVEVSFPVFYVLLELWMKSVSRRLAHDLFIPINHKESTRSSCPEMKAGEQACMFRTPSLHLPYILP